MELSTIITLVIPLLSVIISLLSVIISLFAYLKPNSRQIEAYSTVYTTITKATQNVDEQGYVSVETVNLYVKAKSEACVYLPKKIANYLDQLLKDAKKAAIIREQYLYPSSGHSGLPVGKERSEKTKQMYEYIKKLSRADEKVSKLISPYLKKKF